MNTELQETRPERFKNAIEALNENITLLELGYMLVQACEETIAEGKQPHSDPAVILISGRIGFVSPADAMSSETWNKLVYVCENDLEARVEMREGVLQ